RAEQIVESVLRASDAPFFMKEDAKAWKKSIADWKSESGRTAKTPQGLRAEAARLYAKARESQAFPMDRTADIAYLRSASSAHDFLQVAKDPLEISEGLLLAGTAYEVMTPLQAESLHENFYEMCIRRSPHTPVAEICYRR